MIGKDQPNSLVSFPWVPGVTYTVTNEGDHGVIYRASFISRGWVRFSVPPGGTFEFIADTVLFELHVDAALPSGIRIVPND